MRLCMHVNDTCACACMCVNGRFRCCARHSAGSAKASKGGSGDKSSISQHNREILQQKERCTTIDVSESCMHSTAWQHDSAAQHHVQSM
jgi:hypothetical protein